MSIRMTPTVCIWNIDGSRCEGDSYEDFLFGVIFCIDIDSVLEVR